MATGRTYMKTFSGSVTVLADNEVFVFGANPQGFHGAGAAGFATFGQFGNRWREHGYDKWPDGTKGRWNVKGRIGPMEGTHGKSFGLVTVAKAGAKRSHPIDYKPLFECCLRNPHWTFYLAQEGSVGLNGWFPDEVARMMRQAGPLPPNLHISASFAPYVTEAYA